MSRRSSRAVTAGGDAGTVAEKPVRARDARRCRPLLVRQFAARELRMFRSSSYETSEISSSKASSAPTAIRGSFPQVSGGQVKQGRPLRDDFDR